MRLMKLKNHLQLLAAALVAITLFALPAEARPLSIVALGDSNTNGFGIGRASAWPIRIEERLRAKGYDVRIHNAGVTASTTAGGLKRLNNAVPGGTDAVIVFLGRNDMRFRVSPAVTHRNLDQTVGELRKRGISVLLIGFEPYNFSAIARENGAAYYPDFFAGVTNNGVKQSQYVLRFDPFRHLNASGHAVIAMRLLPAVERLIDGIRREN